MTKTATMNGSAQVSTTLIQVRGRRSSLTSSTVITGATDLVRSGAGHREHDVLQRALLRADRADPQPGADQPGVERGGVGVADQQPLPVPVLHLPVEQRGHLVGVRGVHDDPARRRAQRRQVVLQDQPSGVQDPDPGAQLLDLGQQVAGQEDGHPGVVQPDEQLPQVPDPAGIQAVARLVQDEQPGPADQRGGQAEALPHAQRVGLDRPAADSGQADLLQRLVDPLAPGAPGLARTRRPGPWDPPRPAASGWPGRTGADRRRAPRSARRSAAAPRGRAGASAGPAPRSRRWSRRPGRAACGPAWSCPTRSARAGRTGRPRGRRGRPNAPR